MARVLLLLLGALAVWAAIRAIRISSRRRMFHIQIRHGLLQMHGEVPRHPRSETLDFIEVLGLPEGSEIWGVPSDRGFQLAFTRHVPELTRQRIRNFLYLR